MFVAPNAFSVHCSCGRESESDLAVFRFFVRGPSICTTTVDWIAVVRWLVVK
jgi:hypothetical protein